MIHVKLTSAILNSPLDCIQYFVSCFDQIDVAIIEATRAKLVGVRARFQFTFQASDRNLHDGDFDSPKSSEDQEGIDCRLTDKGSWHITLYGPIYRLF